MADWFHAPEIADIDLGGWTGKAGEAIRVKAIDDVQVKEVKVVITDEQDTVIEQGVASNGGEWWTYVATAAANGSAKVLVSATDLPGHVAQMTKQK
jgi:hypothetical protein